MAKPIDVEAALVALAQAFGVDMCAYPVPSNLGVRLPLTVCQRTGGATSSKVLDAHDISLDCYAATWDAAVQAANDACGLIHEAEGQTMGGNRCIKAQLRTLPYNNPDPLRPDLPRVTLSATLTMREI